jgi:hypothetical protein
LGNGIIQVSAKKTLLMCKLDKPHAIVHEEANRLAQECSGENKVLCSKESIEKHIHAIEDASREVFSILDDMVDQRSNVMMKKASEELFN